MVTPVPRVTDASSCTVGGNCIGVVTFVAAPTYRKKKYRSGSTTYKLLFVVSAPYTGLKR